MIKTAFALTILVFGLGFSEAFSAKEKSEKLEKKVISNSDIILEMDGKIFPIDTFPAICKNLVKGDKCSENSFGVFHAESKKEGDRVYSKTIFTGPEGVQVIEQSWQKDGKVSKAILENRALGKTSELEVKNGKIYFTTRDADGTTETSEGKAEDNLVVPSTLLAYIRPHFKELLKGKELKLKVAVLDRRDTFSFIMKKIREEKSINGQPIVLLQMAPASIFVRAVVDPMLFYTYPDTGKTFAYEGRSALRRKDGDRYKEITARVAYEYKIDREEPISFNTSTSCLPSEITGELGATKCEVKPK